MTEPIPVPTSLQWQEQFKKAALYSEKMQEKAPEDWEYGLWSALSMEHVCRAALSKISPVLLVDASDWNNLLYAIGGTPTIRNYSVKTIPTSDVINRLEKILPEFDDSSRNFCLRHANNRNKEMHTAELAFEGQNQADWLPKYFAALEILLNHLELHLSDLFNSEQVDTAKKIIDAAADETAKSIKGLVNAHRTIWESHPGEEKEKLKVQAMEWGLPSIGHRVACPACHCNALLTGDPIDAPKQKIEGDYIEEKQTYLPSGFECIACKLKISSLSKLTHCGLGDTYTGTNRYNIDEFYAEQGYHYYEPEFEQDYND